MDLTIHTLETAPQGSKAMVEKSLARYKFLPNLHGVMAGSPVMYEAYQSIGAIYGKATLSVLERQIVLQSINYENECHYCLAAHSMIATMEKMPKETLAALRAGVVLADPKLQTLRAFAALMTRQRGWVDDADVEAFYAVGYTEENLLEIIVAIAYKVMSNYINHVGETALDSAFEKYAWKSAGEARSSAARTLPRTAPVAAGRDHS
jgi:alkylhydroperoxidase family enzyme